MKIENKENTNNRKIFVMLIILLILTVFIVCGGLLFRIQKVDCQIRSTPNFELNEEIVKEIGQKFNGQSILYFSLDEAKKWIENEYKYAKVQVIKKEFPATLVVWLSERYEIFAVENSGEYQVLDAELFEIRKGKDFVSNRNDGSLILVENYAEKYSGELKIIVQTLLDCQKLNILDVCSVLKSIDLADSKCVIKFHSGKACEIVINADFAASLKTFFDKEDNIW